MVSSGVPLLPLTCSLQLQGRVEECCCDVETVDRLNHDRIYPVLSRLLTRPFFNFYQVNLNRGCPFWPDNSKCVLRSCHVEACTEVTMTVHATHSSSYHTCRQTLCRHCAGTGHIDL